MYVFFGPNGWEGAYVRTKKGEKDHNEIANMTSGRISLRESKQTENTQHPEHRGDRVAFRLLKGTWFEPSGNRGECNFELISNERENDASLSGYFITEGDQKQIEHEWRSTKYYHEGTDDAIKKSLFPYQIRWVQAFNSGNYEQCGQLYNEDAVFVAYHGGGPGVHAIKKGLKEIHDWWKTLVVDKKLCNMRTSHADIAVVGPNECSVAYNWFKFGSEKDPEGVGMAGQILSEIWVRRGGNWLLQRNIVQTGHSGTSTDGGQGLGASKGGGQGLGRRSSLKPDKPEKP